MNISICLTSRPKNRWVGMKKSSMIVCALGVKKARTRAQQKNKNCGQMKGRGHSAGRGFDCVSGPARAPSGIPPNEVAPSPTW